MSRCTQALAQCNYVPDGGGAARPSSLLLDCRTDGREWVDTFSGVPLTPTELASVDCLPIPPPPDPCTLIDPTTVAWVNNGDGTWSKDLGQGFVITGEHVAGTYAANIGQGLCTPSAPGSMLAFAANPCVGGSGGAYSANNPVGIQFTATRPWPAPFALRVFDIDGNSNTAKHAGPNETVAPSWGLPDSVDGPHASTYRDKGAGQIGAAGAPADGRDFTLVYNNPPQGPMLFEWHGCCIGFDFANSCP